eukprot:193519_1
MRQNSKNYNRRRRPSNLLLYVAFIGITFLCLNVILLIPWLPSPSTDHNHLKKSTKSQNEDIKNRNINFFKLFVNYPLPYHTLRNVTLYGIKRIVAIGDLHGDLDQTKKLLQLTNCINNNSEWIATNTILIQTGDICDRGQHSIEILKLFKSFRMLASSYNSIVFNMLGNHEIRNIHGQFEHTNKYEIESYGGETEFKNIFSLNNNEIGNWLRKVPVVMIIDNTLFSHAGIRSILLEKLNNDIELVNKYATLWLVNGIDEFKQIKDEKERSGAYMVTGSDGPLWSRAFEPRKYFTAAGKNELNEVRNEYGKELVNYCLENEERKEKILNVLIEKYVCQHLQKTLDILGVKRMIKGHDPQPDGKVAQHCNGKSWIIDVGISKAYGGHIGAIEIDLMSDTVNVIGDTHKY